MIKQTIQYRIKGAVIGGQWRDLPPDNALAVAASSVYEFRLLSVLPVGYKYKSRWGNTVYEVMGEPVTNVSQVLTGEAEETTHYPVRAVEDDGREIWHEFEREDYILSREKVAE